MSRSWSPLLRQFLKASDRCGRFVVGLFVQFYRLYLSVFMGGNCKFHPSCSEYALSALKVHSLPRALSLIGIRLCRCHPFRSYSVDLVPAPSPLKEGQQFYAEQYK